MFLTDGWIKTRQDLKNRAVNDFLKRWLMWLAIDTHIAKSWLEYNADLPSWAHHTIAEDAPI
jgi:hypothetical protein